MMVTLAVLSSRQRAAICNGCGSKGGAFRWLKPPALCFTDACDQHDLDYWIGGDQRDKNHADRELWAACKRAVWARAAKHDHGHVHLAASMVAAWIFYIAVRIGGRWSFHYGMRYDADLAVVA